MSKASLKERLRRKQQEIKDRSSGTGNLFFIKEGTSRIRILPVGESEDWGKEITQMYLGKKIQGVISPSSLGLDCPMLEKAQELKEEGSDNTDLLKTLRGRSRYLVPALIYKDDRGKEIDEAAGVKLVLLTGSLYSQLIDFYLDDELGDFTDPESGYDIKIKRVGKGLTDTEYTASPMRSSSIPSKWAKEIDFKALLEEAIPSYEEVEEKLAEYLVSEGSEDDDSDSDSGDAGQAPRKRKKKRRGE